MVEKIYELPKSDKYPSFSLAISFSGQPISSAVTPDAGSASIQQFSLQTMAVPVVHNEPGSENTVEALNAPVQSALDRSESLKDIPECLAEALGFAKEVADLAKTFADVRFPKFLCWFHSH